MYRGGAALWGGVATIAFFSAAAFQLRRGAAAGFTPARIIAATCFLVGGVFFLIGMLQSFHGDRRRR